MFHLVTQELFAHTGLLYPRPIKPDKSHPKKLTRV